MAPNPPSQPSIASGINNAISNAGDWLASHWIWIALFAAGLIALFILLGMRRADVKRRLQRDALERLRKNAVHACKTNRVRGIRQVWTTGSPNQPPIRLGRYRGHTRHLEATWITYKPGLLRRPEVCWAMPADVTSAYDGRELSLRGLGVWQARDFAYLIPDAHDPREQREWAKALGAIPASSDAFVEAVKRYYARAVDNAVSFHDALNAVEDRAFLRQEVTRGESERTDTVSVPAESLDATPEGSAPRSN